MYDARIIYICVCTLHLHTSPYTHTYYLSAQWIRATISSHRKIDPMDFFDVVLFFHQSVPPHAHFFFCA